MHDKILCLLSIDLFNKIIEAGIYEALLCVFRYFSKQSRLSLPQNIPKSNLLHTHKHTYV